MRRSWEDCTEIVIYNTYKVIAVEAFGRALPQKPTNLLRYRMVCPAVPEIRVNTLRFFPRGGIRSRKTLTRICSGRLDVSVVLWVSWQHETYLRSHELWGAAKRRSLLPVIHAEFTISKISQPDVPVRSKQNIIKFEVSVDNFIRVEEVQGKLGKNLRSVL